MGVQPSIRLQATIGNISFHDQFSCVVGMQGGEGGRGESAH